MSAAQPPETKRRMNFRVRDPRFTDGACPKLDLTIVYLDRGDTSLSLDYDATGTEVAEKKKAQGMIRKAGEIPLGNSGEIRRQTFMLEDARFGKGVKPDKADFTLTPAKPTDFVIFGAYLEPEKSSQKKP